MIIVIPCRLKCPLIHGMLTHAGLHQTELQRTELSCNFLDRPWLWKAEKGSQKYPR